MKHECVICGEMGAIERVYSVTVNPKHLKVGDVFVSGIKESFCCECGCTFATPEQIDHNVHLVQEAVRLKENGHGVDNRKTFLQRLAGGGELEETVSDLGTTLGPRKILH